MANSIVAGNSTNGGTAISTDTSGTLNIVTGSGSGATAVTVDGSGNVVVTGTLSASGGVSGGIRSGTAVASTSGTSIDFTGIPSGVKRITVMFNGVSTNSTSIRQIQLGDSGGIETSGYTGSIAITNSAGAGGNTAFSGAGFAITASGNTLAADTMYGSLVFVNVSGNIWVGTGIFVSSNQPCSFYISGLKTLSDTLDRVRITTVNGTDTFDAGSINILFE